MPPPAAVTVDTVPSPQVILAVKSEGVSLRSASVNVAATAVTGEFSTTPVGWSRVTVGGASAALPMRALWLALAPPASTSDTLNKRPVVTAA